MDFIAAFIQKLEPANWISLTCGGISITISILIGMWNYRHARRQFRAAYYPHLKMELKDKQCNSGVCPHLHIKNMSKDKVVINANVKLQIRNPVMPSLLNFPWWLDLITREKIEINAGEEYILEDSTDKEFKSLEQFMIARFPNYISADKIGRAQFTYYIAHDYPVRFRAIVSYESSIEGAGRMYIRDEYKIIPETMQHSAQSRRLNYWKF